MPTLSIIHIIID